MNRRTFIGSLAAAAGSINCGTAPLLTRIVGGLARDPRVELEESRERLREAIESLPRIYWQILHLRHARKMSYRQMSGFLRVPVATIEARLYRARIRLKGKLSPEFAVKGNFRDQLSAVF